MIRKWVVASIAVLLIAAASEAQAWPWKNTRPSGTIAVSPAEVTVGDKYNVEWTCENGTASIDGYEQQGQSGSLEYTASVVGEKTHTIIVHGSRLRAFTAYAVENVKDKVDPTPPPVPPVPPVPPEPVNGLRVLIGVQSPRDIRGLAPEQVALLTSRTLRDWTAAACAKVNGLPEFRVFSKSAPVPADWASMMALVPEGKQALVATVPGKDALVLDPLPDFKTAIAKLQEYSGQKVEAKPAAMKLPRLFTSKEWDDFIGKGGVAEFGGKKRYLTSKPRDLKKVPYGKAPGTVPLSETGVRIIPREDWPKYLAAFKEANAGLEAMLYGLVPSSDQEQTNFCWANAVTNSGSTMRCEMGLGSYLLSAASVACPITNFRDQGGWPLDAMNYMEQKGAVRASLWPNAAISRSYLSKAGVAADYANHKIVASIADLGASGKMFDEVVTCVLLGCPVAVSYDWWGHAVMAVGVAYQNGTWYLICRNSWGESYGDLGFFLLPEGTGNKHGTPGDAQALMLMSQVVSSPVGGDGASLKSILNPKRIIELELQVEVEQGCQDGTCPTCPGGRCGGASPGLLRRR